MSEPSTNSRNELAFRDFFVPVWAERKRVLIISIVVGLATLGINFLMPKYYKADATILPDTDKNRLGSMTSLAGLASLAGVNVSGSDISRLYPVILTSESVLTAIVERRYASEQFKDSVNLIQYMKLDEGTPEKNLEEAIKELRELLVVSLDNKTSVVNASVEMPEPRLAADVLNAALDELDLFLREKRTTSAMEQRKWIESRLVQVSVELRSAEESLKNFRERNRQVASPQLLLEQDRLAREVQVKGSIDLELQKQAEIAKIDEIKQVTTINVLDEGRMPTKKDRPKRATNAAIAFFVALVCASGYFATRSLYGERIMSYIRSLA
jgi:uncharacterized protein involved in exopolysaccharide biosynthesis